MWDLGGAAAQMMLVAWELGIGSCPATVYEQTVARELLGYPAGHGTASTSSRSATRRTRRVLTAPNRPGGRRPLDEVVHQRALVATRPEPARTPPARSAIVEPSVERRRVQASAHRALAGPAAAPGAGAPSAR